MSKFTEKFKKAAKFSFAFFVIAFLFLLAVVGTSGAVQSTGKAYELIANTDSNKAPCVLFKVSAPQTVTEDEKGEEKIERQDAILTHVYLNVGTVYSDERTVTLRLRRSASSTTKPENYSTTNKMTDTVIVNPWYEEKADDEAVEGEIKDAGYNWIDCFSIANVDESIRKYTGSKTEYFCLSVPKINNYVNSNLLLNEVVFVGEELNESGVSTGKECVMHVEIDERTYLYIPEQNSDLSKEEALNAVSALIDAQKIPNLTSSSFFRYGKDEADMMATLAEMRLGKRYTAGDTYHGNTSYNSLGISLAYLGTAIFGTSPFGLRFFNGLFSFGVLVVGYFLVRRIFHSETAAVSFAAIYSLSAITVSLAHLAQPMMSGVFFLLLALYFVYGYYENGLKKAAPSATLPLAIAGLSAALSVTVHGAFVLGVALVVALFVLGVLKERRLGRLALDVAIEAVEEEEAEKAKNKRKDAEEEQEESEKKKHLRSVLSSYRYKTGAASGVFAVALVLGIFLFALLFSLPVSYAVHKIYVGSAIESGNLFLIGWHAFAAGFTGASAGDWAYFYPVFTGAGSMHAATIACVNFASSLLGLCGIAYAVYHIVMLALKKAPMREYMNVCVPLAFLLVSLITASFAGGAVAFVFSAHLFAFMLIAGGAEKFKQEGNVQAKVVFFGKIAALALLVIFFGLLAVFTFSVPLPEAFMAKFLL